jgi:hypothetical protein
MRFYVLRSVGDAAERIVGKVPALLDEVMLQAGEARVRESRLHGRMFVCNASHTSAEPNSLVVMMPFADRRADRS